MTSGSFNLFLLMFLPGVLIATLILGITYVNDQQVLRLGADEPQIQMAQDAATRVAAGATPEDVLGGSKIAIETMASPYLVMYDANGTPVSGTGYLNGSLPVLPGGVFDQAKRLGIDTISWEPEKGVREAIVVVPVMGQLGGFVLAGRSLRYVEQQEDMLTKRTAVGWAVVVVALALAALFIVFVLKRTRKN